MENVDSDGLKKMEKIAEMIRQGRLQQVGDRMGAIVCYSAILLAVATIAGIWTKVFLFGWVLQGTVCR